VREECYRVAGRRGLPVILVGNGSRPVRPPPLPNARLVIVAEGADAADDWIVEHIAAADICVTADIPLAARCLARDAKALSPKGHVWTTANIGGALAGREISRHLREIGAATSGPSAFAQKDRSNFLQALDRLIAQKQPGAPPPKPPPG
jgi:uncharacterized protein YaiI (UPF0178 family)